MGDWGGDLIAGQVGVWGKVITWKKKEEMSGEICEVWNLLSKMQDGTNLEREKKKGNGYV